MVITSSSNNQNHPSMFMAQNCINFVCNLNTYQQMSIDSVNRSNNFLEANVCMQAKENEKINRKNRHQ